MARTHTLASQDVAAHLKLTAGEVTRVVFPDDVDTVEVMARDGASDVWYCLWDATPAPEAGHCYVLPAGAVGTDQRQPRTSGATVVSLLAPAATAVTVQRAG